MRAATIFMIFASLLLGAAIFGFFYAWVCSTMWGLDAADPRVAIAAMQAMNASVRNIVFFPPFFLTPLAMAITAALLARRQRGPAIAFAVGALIYLLGGLILTITINVPMNEALALTAVPNDAGAATDIWRAYSERWRFWNQTRTLASGLAFLAAAFGTFLIDRRAL